jgi:hypothetical protein
MSPKTRHSSNNLNNPKCPLIYPHTAPSAPSCTRFNCSWSGNWRESSPPGP